MAKVRVHLQKRDDPKAQVSVTVDANVSKENFVFLYPTMNRIIDKKQPLSPKFPNVTYGAIRAAVESGALYARHRVNATSLSVELLSFEMEGNVSDVIPFAVATTIAIYDAIAGIRSYTEKDLEAHWDVVSVDRI